MSGALGCDFTRGLIPASVLLQSKLESPRFVGTGCRAGDALSHLLSEALRCVLLIGTN